MLRNNMISTYLKTRLLSDLSAMDEIPKLMSDRHRLLIYADLVRSQDARFLEIHITEKMIKAEYGKVCKELRTKRQLKETITNRLKKEGYDSTTIKRFLLEYYTDKYCHVNHNYLLSRLQKHVRLGISLADALAKCKEEVLNEFNHYTDFKLYSTTPPN